LIIIKKLKTVSFNAKFTASSKTV